MQLFLNKVSARQPGERIVMVIDGAGLHRSVALKAAENIYLLKLPPYAPEINPIEQLWDELGEKFFITVWSKALIRCRITGLSAQNVRGSSHNRWFHSLLAVDLLLRF